MSEDLRQYGNVVADRGVCTDMSNAMIEDQFHTDESQDLHRLASPILRSGSQGSGHAPCTPMIGAMSKVALWNHTAFVSAIEVLCVHDRGECMTRLYEAREKILEMITTYENIGGAIVRNSETQLIVAHYYYCVCHIILNGFA